MVRAHHAYDTMSCFFAQPTRQIGIGKFLVFVYRYGSLLLEVLRILTACDGSMLLICTSDTRSISAVSAPHTAITHNSGISADI